MRALCVPQAAPLPLQKKLGPLGTGTRRSVRNKFDAWAGLPASVQTQVLTSVEGMAPKQQPKGAPKKPKEAEAQAAEAAQREAPNEEAEAALVPKEGKLQAPKESAT